MKKICLIITLLVACLANLSFCCLMYAKEDTPDKVSIDLQTVWDLRNVNLDKKDIFSCLTRDVRTYDALYSKMCDKFPSKVDSIKACFTRYGLMSETEDLADVTFEDRAITTATTITADKITVRNVNVINGGELTLVGKVEIYPVLLVENGSSLEIRSH